jgi:DTW domain-containing protein YfiP
LQSADEQSRLQMISLAQSGADIGNAATQTANALRANLSAAQNTGLANGLGDVFGATAQAYKAQQDAQARRRGLQDATLYANPFSRSTGSTGGL